MNPFDLTARVAVVTGGGGGAVAGDEKAAAAQLALATAFYERVGAPQRVSQRAREDSNLRPAD